MLTVKVKSNVKFPQLNFQKELKEIADTIFIPTMQLNIKNQVSLDEGPLPDLEPSTILKKTKGIIGRKQRIIKKAKKGLKINIAGYGKQIAVAPKSNKEIASLISGIGVQKLIDTGKLLSSFYSKLSGKNNVIITLNNNRKDIGSYLQIDGVGKKKKKFNFFGVSTRMEQGALTYMKKKIVEKLNA